MALIKALATLFFVRQQNTVGLELGFKIGFKARIALTEKLM